MPDDKNLLDDYLNDVKAGGIWLKISIGVLAAALAVFLVYCFTH